MDLNQLYANHQRALVNARRSEGPEDRQTYFDLVEYYAKRIRQYRHDAGLPAISLEMRGVGR
ncbi:hypothetical protein [Novosphingobium sp. MBES04]|uniref:hypothetical protein n=1 Tax=Novosphingobium sp. MBES04 TaxID=1206458 RepID=UPI00057EB758|nr:hypothetical protein [Novosphingobium sp. MBES04]